MLAHFYIHGSNSPNVARKRPSHSMRRRSCISHGNWIHWFGELTYAEWKASLVAFCPVAYCRGFVP